MALPSAINTPAELKQALQHYVDNHTNLHYLVFGSMKELTDTLKKKKKTEIGLFCPHPSVIARDTQGSLDYRFAAQIMIMVPCASKDYESPETAMNAILPTVQQLLIRMRSDASDYGWSFDINDIGQIDPVIDSFLDTVAGWQWRIQFGDFYSVKVNTANWADL